MKSLFTAVPCLVCGRKFHRVAETEWAEMQPVEGVICRTSGNFGSRVLDGETVTFLVCDLCLTERRERVRATVVEHPKSNVYYSPWDA